MNEADLRMRLVLGDRSSNMSDEKALDKMDEDHGGDNTVIKRAFVIFFIVDPLASRVLANLIFECRTPGDPGRYYNGSNRARPFLTEAFEPDRLFNCNNRARQAF